MSGNRRKPDLRIDQLPSSEFFMDQHRKEQQKTQPKEPILIKSSSTEQPAHGLQPPITVNTNASTSQQVLGANSSSVSPVEGGTDQLYAPPSGVISPHQKHPSVHAHFKLDEVVGHSGVSNRSRSGSVSDKGGDEAPDGTTPSAAPVQPAPVAAAPAPAAAAPATATQPVVSNLATTPMQMPIADPRLPDNDGKLHILIGATGSVSTGRLRLIINKLEDIYGKHKISVQLILTKAAEGFVRPNEIPTQVTVWRDEDEWQTWKKRADPVLHIELRRWADILIVAPLTANTLSKIALGLCDNLLTNVVRAWNTAYPILIAPAMLSYAYNHPATKRHLRVIKEDMKWIEVLKPTEKVVGTFGDIGMGGMMDWNEIVDKVVMKLGGYPDDDDDEDDDGEEQKALDQADDEVDEQEDEEEIELEDETRAKLHVRERQGSL